MNDITCYICSSIIFKNVNNQTLWLIGFASCSSCFQNGKMLAKFKSLFGLKEQQETKIELKN